MAFEKSMPRAQRRYRGVEDKLLAKLKRVLARVPFGEDLLATYYAVLDRETPHNVRATLLGALAYFMFPFDVIPDFIIGLGYTDDATVLYLALRAVKDSIRETHYEAARRWLDEVSLHPAGG